MGRLRTEFILPSAEFVVSSSTCDVCLGWPHTAAAIFIVVDLPSPLSGEKTENSAPYSPVKRMRGAPNDAPMIASSTGRFWSVVILAAATQWVMSPRGS
jgi:hypothetical protein